jgi:hypothetical protein
VQQVLRSNRSGVRISPGAPDPRCLFTYCRASQLEIFIDRQSLAASRSLPMAGSDRFCFARSALALLFQIFPAAIDLATPFSDNWLTMRSASSNACSRISGTSVVSHSVAFLNGPRAYSFAEDYPTPQSNARDHRSAMQRAAKSMLDVLAIMASRNECIRSEVGVARFLHPVDEMIGLSGQRAHAPGTDV